MTEAAIAKWNKAAKCLEASQHGEELRYGIFKRQLFGKATGRTMLVAAGTGVDFKYFPADVDLTAIDFSPTMLEYTEKKVGECRAPMTLKEADVTCLDFPDAHFDTVATSCTFCSVPDPVKGLREVRRVLKDDGALLMFEHVRPVQLLPGLPDGPDEPGGQTDRTRHQPSNRRQCPGGGIPADAGVQRLSRYGESVRGGEGGVSRSGKAYRPVPLSTYERLDENEMIERARAFRDELRRRRTVRHYSGEPVPQEVIEACIEAAGTAPNGANRQPWHFVVVRDPEVKSRIRKQAEEEELDFYENRAPPEWLEALAHLGTDSHKPFLEEAPVLIAIFAKSYRLVGGEEVKNYYVTESVGIATGMLITGLHRAGLAMLTHTPSPMGFLNEILGRPKNERPFLLLVVGYPVDEALVPDITKKPLAEIASFR